MKNFGEEMNKYFPEYMWLAGRHDNVTHTGFWILDQQFRET